MINELFDLWVHRTYTPVQALSMVAAYLGFVSGGVGIGWLLRGLRK